MTDDWIPKETTTNQDHVIAHVLGTTVLGYFVHDEALYLLLDIGFVWTIFVDGEMSLLPHPVAVSELEMNGQRRGEISADIDLLLGDNEAVEKLSQIQPPPLNCQSRNCAIKEVSFYELENRRRLILEGEEASLAIETSLTIADIEVYEFQK